MKIKYIKLENFIGIYIGTGRYKIEIDFEKSKNRIVMLEGNNGSGKSSLLSTLHPFAGTMDERNEIILDGKQGKKTIIISHDGYEYNIVHHYKPLKSGKRTISSYIGKRPEDSDQEWVELNETGTVKSFKEVVLKELDVEESFFRLSRIGSNVTNFIDLKTAERKKYLSLFLSEIDEYLHFYNIVGEKYRKTNLLLKSIAEDINKLGSEDDLNMTREGLESRIKDNQKKFDKNSTEISKYQGSIEELDKDSNIMSRYEELKEEIEDLELDIENTNTKREKIILNNPGLGEVTDFNAKLISMEKKKSTTEASVGSIKNSLEKIRSDIEMNNKSLKEKQAQFDKFRTKETLDELNDLQTEYQNQIKENNDEIDKDYSAYKKFKNTSSDCQSTNTNFLAEFIKVREGFTSNTPLGVITKLLEIIEKYGSEDAESHIISVKETANNALKRNKEKSMQIENSIAFMEKERKLVETLSKRPANCKIDSCPFIADAMKIGDVDSKITQATERLEVLKKNVSRNESDLNDAEELFSALISLNKVLDFVSHMESQITNYPIGKVILKQSIPDLINYKEDKLRKVVTNFCHYASLVENNKSLEKDLEEISQKIEMLSSNKEFLESIQSDINTIEKKLTDLNLESEDLEEDLSKANRKILACQKIISDLNSIIELDDTLKTDKDKIKENNKELHQMDDQVRKINIYKSKISDLEESNEEILSYLEPDKERLEEIKIKIAKIKDYEQKKEDLDEKYENYGIIRDALSPTKGIPLIFLNVYLKKTKDICNNLLNIAYNGELQIVNFDISETDFFIKVRRNNGEVLNDISIASQGEQALVSVAISFALIEQSLKKYNIILLDEIDSTLDQTNRRSFIDILDAQLDSLNVEQTFIISHNKEFDSSPVDLILFKGHETDIKNLHGLDKTVLFKI